MRLFILPLTLFAALVALLGASLLLDRDTLDSPLIGEPAPSFAAPDLHDPTHTVSLAEAAGQVVAVNVWASWCPPCLEEHPHIMTLADTIPVYGLNYKDERNSARRWLARQGDSYAASAVDPSGRIALDWGVYGVPETFLIDAQGVVRYKYVGPITAELLAEDVLPRVRRLQQEAQ